MLAESFQRMGVSDEGIASTLEKFVATAEATIGHTFGYPILLNVTLAYAVLSECLRSFHVVPLARRIPWQSMLQTLPTRAEFNAFMRSNVERMGRVQMVQPFLVWGNGC